MRLGLFGGTFDPVHCGHIDVAQAARRALALDTVWLIPSRTPPHRPLPSASAAHRFAMAALAVAEEDGLKVSDLEMDISGPSYTVDTLDRLQARGINAASAYFVTGADAFRDIRSWKAFPKVLDRCHFVVVSRPGMPVAGLRAAHPDLRSRMIDAPWNAPDHPGIFLVDAPTAPVSSTSIRHAIDAGTSLDRLVPRPVAAHIHRHSLYVSQEGHL